MRIWVVLLVVAAASPVMAAGQAEGQADAPPRAIKALLDCRAIADGAARLACFDREAAAFGTALAEKNVVVADREEVREARRSLFGLALPTINLFGKDDDEKVMVDAIEATLTAARPGPDRKWRFVLDNGSRWAQTDTRTLVRDPKAGMPMKIRKAAAGSFLANVDGQTAIRVERVN